MHCWPDSFAPTLSAANARIEAVRPSAYAKTRNHLDGAVSGLSPYITHGFVTLHDVLSGVSARHALATQHKFVFELGWRAYFRHVWHHRGEHILRSLHEGPLPESAYASSLPSDIRGGCTGIPVVDEAVRVLYSTGMLHNHARMWLASYVVHIRKVHWRAGADWMYGHLLDGDLASNHLSWQWVAGTASHKPYLFNADNVARYAPEPWHSFGSVMDAPYEALDRMARQPTPGANAPLNASAVHSVVEPQMTERPPASLATALPSAAVVADRDVWLVHPWNLRPGPTGCRADARTIGIVLTDFHGAWPWSERRWRFVVQRMNELAHECWLGSAESMHAALQGARSVRSSFEPHLLPWLPRLAQCDAEPDLFARVTRRCDSFSQWWSRATRDTPSARDLLVGSESAPW